MSIACTSASSYLIPYIHHGYSDSVVRGSAQRGAGARHSGQLWRRATHVRMHSRWKVCEQGSSRATCEGWIVSRQIEQVDPSPPFKPDSLSVSGSGPPGPRGTGGLKANGSSSSSSGSGADGRCASRIRSFAAQDASNARTPIPM